MKFVRKLFSRFVLSALLFLTQMVLLWVFLSVLDLRYWWLQVARSILAIAVFLSMVYKKESPEYKLPWLFLIMLFPLFGTMLFLFYAHPRMKPKDRKTLAAIDEGTRPYVGERTPEECFETATFLGHYRGIESYLHEGGHLYGDLSTRVSFFPLGEDYWVDLLKELDKAERFIFLEFFIIAPGKMWDAIHEILLRKVGEGVEVRVLYDDIGSAATTPARFCKDLQKEGIKCLRFSPFRPFITTVFNNRDHRKIVVIDGKVGYTGGVNIGDEYINYKKRFGHWKDTGIKLEGPAVKNFSNLFLHAYDLMAKELSDYKKYLAVEVEPFQNEGYVHPFGDGPKPYYNEQVGKGNFLNLIGLATSYVWITTPYLITDFSLTDALRNAAMRGVDVRIFTPHIPDKKAIFAMTRSNYAFLKSAGVRIYEYTPGFLHAKMLLSDDKVAFVGTINLDYRSLTHHYECGAVIGNSPCLAAIRKDFEEIIEVSEEITPERAKKLRSHRPSRMIMHIFEPIF